MTVKIAMPTLKYFGPSVRDEASEEDSSTPPMIQRIRPIVVGSWAIWMVRLRREIAVARLVTMLLLQYCFS